MFEFVRCFRCLLIGLGSVFICKLSRDDSEMVEDTFTNTFCLVGMPRWLFFGALFFLFGGNWTFLDFVDMLNLKNNCIFAIFC
jgi:hypothetical protein